MQSKLDALATVTANLYHGNIDLKKKLSKQQQRRLAVLDDGV
ncbi:hypothetical protein ACPXCE_17265 [Streptomyces sp. DT24]|nr:hypothetical protein [Streptomyces sp. AM 4-1-1]WEH31994.1 hypothetical protein PZB75_00530 [Streptomyces sp. AM 4-1-1]